MAARHAVKRNTGRLAAAKDADAGALAFGSRLLRRHAHDLELIRQTRELVHIRCELAALGRIIQVKAQFQAAVHAGKDRLQLLDDLRLEDLAGSGFCRRFLRHGSSRAQRADARLLLHLQCVALKLCRSQRSVASRRDALAQRFDADVASRVEAVTGCLHRRVRDHISLRIEVCNAPDQFGRRFIAGKDEDAKRVLPRIIRLDLPRLSIPAGQTAQQAISLDRLHDGVCPHGDVRMIARFIGRSLGTTEIIAAHQAGDM